MRYTLITITHADAGGPDLEGEVLTQDLSPRQLAQAQADPSIPIVAPADIPLALIEPAQTPPQATGSTWGLQALGVPDTDRTGAGTTVAVLDTGCDLDHPAFAHLDCLSRTFTEGDPADVHGHGTHCAATLCGGPIGGEALGVAPGIQRLLIGKVLGPGTTSDTLIRALWWAVMDQRAQVVSMSLAMPLERVFNRHRAAGQPVPVALDTTLRTHQAFRTAMDHMAGLFRDRALLIGAAGNHSARPDYTMHTEAPASCRDILAVGAVDEGLAVAGFSNQQPDLVGPGVGVRSAAPGGGLSTNSGTSMATPHVAGLAALWREHLGANTSPRAVRDALIASCRRIPGAGPEDVGRGLPQAPPRG